MSINISKTEARRRLVEEIIAGGKCKTYEDIVAAHRKAYKAGEHAELFELSQPTVSRDLKKLNIKKNLDGYYVLDPNSKSDLRLAALTAMLQDSQAQEVHSISVLSVTCASGYERLLADRMQETYAGDVVGTLCGSGIVVVLAVRDEEDTVAQRIADEVRGIIQAGTSAQKE